ncbi:YhbY family RNA-binding protein [Bifidobacterium sp.]|jgi:RNA-binding protein|uniref:YhbY family RNA-binding protein n=1 Tax=Bifidobacterium sp. TaxID=41200 RepID=UPI0025C4974C|nr:YhbY family RNA-binding protein [Bifidobacterium sp.]MCH4208750.1 YhbY family RNA-binding protein [Bifidobacterium sp.]MCI1224010.1 YhbY family RNA-binding protein [Bifidobacterium sp.]
MTLGKRQIRQLRSLANPLQPLLWIGKGGVNEATAAQAAETLDSHELIKCVVQDGCPIDAREAGQDLAGRLAAELVQVIGHRFVLFRRSDKEGIKHIELAR